MPFDAKHGKSCLFQLPDDVLCLVDILDMLFVKTFESAVRTAHEERDIHLNAVGEEMRKAKICHIVPVIRKNIICNFFAKFV